MTTSNTIWIFALGFLVGLFLPQNAVSQSIDEMIAAAATVNDMDYLTDIGKTAMTELDMVLLWEQYDALKGDDKTRKKRKAWRDEKYRWTNKVIPYKIAPGKFSSRDRQEIMRAINEWQQYTCLRFTPAGSQHKNHIYFDDGSGCYSYVGMIGGAQTVGLAGGCRHKGVIVHEVGHAVGFHHEQNRPDRDNHVIINRHNIPESLYYNFKKYPYSSVNTYDVPYDYGSVMHYGGRAFSKNGQLTIQTRKSSDQHKIGNREGLSFFDIKLANLMYKCSSSCGGKTCSGHGFVGKDCKCYCPGNPVRLCDDSGTGGKVTEAPTQKPSTTAAPGCEDMNKYCSGWAEAGYCSRSSYMTTYCKKSCNLCPTESCRDSNEHCTHWANAGYCKGEYEGYMKDKCAKSCEYCIASRGEAGAQGGGEESGGGDSTGIDRSGSGGDSTGIDRPGSGGDRNRSARAGVSTGLLVFLSSLTVMKIISIIPYY